MTVFLDTETTGLSPSTGDAIVEVAIVDNSGRALVNTLIDPQRSIPLQATRIHGITNDMVRGKPTIAELMPCIVDVIRAEQVVIYNAKFDAPFFPGGLRQAHCVDCAMTLFADVLQTRWQKLDKAARHVGHNWTGSAHRALADAMACRSVWNWLVRQGHASSFRTARSSSAERGTGAGRSVQVRSKRWVFNRRQSTLTRVADGKVYTVEQLDFRHESNFKGWRVYDPSVVYVNEVDVEYE